ncbi:MAG: hypothetical protein Q8900_06160 [Bacillota bacterium]|nr:hypothetical protein [Bacillota bacterium]
MIKTKKGYSNNILDKNDLAYEEESEENGICEFCEGTAVASYDFTGETVQSSSDNNNDLKGENIILTDNRKGKNSSNNITPPIDNEPFKYKRCYQFRESTLRMLNEIKAKHPNINVYLNTIVDEAVRYYYKNIIENNESKG